MHSCRMQTFVFFSPPSKWHGSSLIRSKMFILPFLVVIFDKCNIFPVELYIHHFMVYCRLHIRFAIDVNIIVFLKLYLSKLKDKNCLFWGFFLSIFLTQEWPCILCIIHSFYSLLSLLWTTASDVCLKKKKHGIQCLSWCKHVVVGWCFEREPKKKGKVAINVYSLI